MSPATLCSRRRPRPLNPLLPLPRCCSRPSGGALTGSGVFARRKLSKPFPWLTRIDVGMHTGGLNDAERSADWPKGKPKFFLNEIEIVPTYYIAKQFRHQVTHDRLPRPSFSLRSFSRAET